MSKARFKLPIPLESGIVLVRINGEAWTNVETIALHHSPDGFEWGYAGSGPADLALNIVEHALRKLGYNGEKFNDIWSKAWIYKMSWTLHQDFKFEFLYTVPEHGTVIGWTDVLAWVATRAHEMEPRT